jgi:hypothetical protein
MPKIIYADGTSREFTAAEIAAMKTESIKAQMAERKRPLTEQEVTALLIRQSVNTLEVDDNTALRMMDYYPAFEELCGKAYTAEKVGYKFQYGGKLYKTRQANYTFVAHYPPEAGTESLYEAINETHSGTEADPIPYEGNMALTNGLYYVQDYVVYRCTRDTGAPIYRALADLTGVYVEEV